MKAKKSKDNLIKKTAKIKKLSIKDLIVSVEKKQIVKGISLDVKPGEIHVIMGPNGSGKSTVALSLMGHPHYSISSQKNKNQKNKKSSVKKTLNSQNSPVSLNGISLINKSPDQRAKLGLFLAFQYPVSIDGISTQNFLFQLYKTKLSADDLKSKEQNNNQDKNQNQNQSKNKKQKINGKSIKTKSDKIDVFKFRKHLISKAKKLGIHPSLLKRYLNDDFSGGEKKRIEILQLAVLKPKYAILDETDSGLDIDSIKTIAKGINETISKQKTGIILITHYKRILKFIKPNLIHIMIDGKIVKTGTKKLVKKIEKSGYKSFIK